jgi:phenylalanyl-tRNA synthetase beta chain
LVDAHWTGPGREADLADLKGMVELVAGRLAVGPVTYERAVGDPLYHPGRAASAVAAAGDGSAAIAGRLGEVHPATLAAWDVRAERLLAAELAIAGLSAGSPPTMIVGPMGRTSTHRDLALVVGDDVDAGAVLAVVREAGGERIDDVVLFDIYAGPPLDASERSLAIRITVLTDEPADDGIDDVIGAIRDAAAREVGARVRA